MNEKYQKIFNWKEILSETMETLRTDFINGKYGADWNFESLFFAKTGLSKEVFKELNELSIRYMNEEGKNSKYKYYQVQLEEEGLIEIAIKGKSLQDINLHFKKRYLDTNKVIKIIEERECSAGYHLLNFSTDLFWLEETDSSIFKEEEIMDG